MSSLCTDICWVLGKQDIAGETDRQTERTEVSSEPRKTQTLTLLEKESIVMTLQLRKLGLEKIT